MEQGTEDWHEWRSKGLGSSDAAIIMGTSPWKTPLDLWEIKTGRRKEGETNWAMRRGNELEPKARAYYETIYEAEMPPTLVQHETYPFLRASLDGYSKDGLILEIKCPGKTDHELAKKGKVPEKYVPQLNHQLLVTGARAVHYFSFDGTDGVLVEHLPDRKELKTLLTLELDFWKLIEFDEPPPLTERDFKKIANPNLTRAIMDWKKVKRVLDGVEPKEKELREKMISLCEHPRMRGSGLKIQQVYRKGAIDYKLVPELKGLDLEPFRKKTTSAWRIDPE